MRNIVVVCLAIVLVASIAVIAAAILVFNALGPVIAQAIEGGLSMLLLEMVIAAVVGLVVIAFLGSGDISRLTFPFTPGSGLIIIGGGLILLESLKELLGGSP